MEFCENNLESKLCFFVRILRYKLEIDQFYRSRHGAMMYFLYICAHHWIESC